MLGLLTYAHKQSAEVLLIVLQFLSSPPPNGLLFSLTPPNPELSDEETKSDSKGEKVQHLFMETET